MSELSERVAKEVYDFLCEIKDDDVDYLEPGRDIKNMPHLISLAHRLNALIPSKDKLDREVELNLAKLLNTSDSLLAIYQPLMAKEWIQSTKGMIPKAVFKRKVFKILVSICASKAIARGKQLDPKDLQSIAMRIIGFQRN